jgi:hypothetical protein
MKPLTLQQITFVRSQADKGGHIEPDHLVEAARDPASPIHDQFEWNDRRAGELYRRDQAQQIIRMVKVEIEIEDRTLVIPYYVSDPDRPVGSHRYVEIDRAARNHETARSVMLDEMRRISAAINRARGVAAALGLDALLDELFRQVAGVVTKIDPPPPRGRRRRRPDAGEGART